MTSSADYSNIDPELDAIFKKYGRPKPFLPERERMALFRQLSSASTRRFMTSSFVKQTLASLSNDKYREEEERTIPVRDGEIQVRIYRPQSSFLGGCPVMIMSHGGGWCLGGLDTESFLCRLFSSSLDLVVVDVAYRLCPEFHYPVPVLDVFDATKWVSTHAREIGGDLTKGFMLCGVSGGGNLTTGVTYLARDEQLNPPLTGSIVMCTGMPHEASDSRGNHISLYPGRCPSWQEHAEAPISSRRTNECYGDLANADISSPLFTPFHSQDHTGLPPLYYQVAGIDPWRDSAFLYTEILEQARVKTKIDVFPGVPHCWWSFYPQLSINRSWVRDTVAGAAWLLRTVDHDQKGSRL